MESTPGDQQVRDALSDLEGPAATGQRLEAVAFHPFPARMPCAVAEHLIQRTTSPGAIVLDPMAGSGTTLVAARRLGRYGIGFDRDPMAVLIARATTQSLAKARVETLPSRVLERAQRSIRQGHLSRLRERLPHEDQQFLRYWFPPHSQKQLFALAAAIQEEAEGPESEFAWAVFSSLIIAKSAGASYALDISRSRPHKVPDKPIVLPFDGWTRRFKAAMARHPFIDTTAAGKATVHLGDARSLPLETDSVDLVLTSPPYLNAIDYLRAHKFSLVWMGYDLKNIRNLRGTMMGTERGLRSLDGLPSALEEHLELTVSASRRRAILRQYLSDLQKVLTEAKRVLRAGGLLVLVVGPTIVTGEEPDAVAVVSELGSNVGLQTIGSAVRSLRAGSRSLPPPSWTLSDSLSKRMQSEILIALRK